MEPFVTIEIAGPPPSKGRPRSRIQTGRSGHQFVNIYTPAATRSAENDVGREGRRAMAGRPPLECALKVEFLAVFPVPASWSKKKRQAALSGDLRPTGKPDWDNIGKLASDALNGICWKDDSQLVDVRTQKFYGERPFLHIEIYA